MYWIKVKLLRHSTLIKRRFIYFSPTITPLFSNGVTDGSLGYAILNPPQRSTKGKAVCLTLSTIGYGDHDHVSIPQSSVRILAATDKRQIWRFLTT